MSFISGKTMDDLRKVFEEGGDEQIFTKR